MVFFNRCNFRWVTGSTLNIVWFFFSIFVVLHAYGSKPWKLPSHDILCLSFFSTWMKIQGRLRTGDHVVAIATTDLLYMGKTNYIMYQFPVHARHVNVDSRGVSKALWYILWNFYLVWIMTVIFILYLPDVWKSLAEENVQSFAHAHWIIFQFVGRITKLMTTNALRSASKPTTEFNYT